MNANTSNVLREQRGIHPAWSFEGKLRLEGDVFSSENKLIAKVEGEPAGKE